MAVLALDLATVSGWALQVDGDVRCGVWDLSKGFGRPHRTRWLNLWWYLAAMHQAHGLTRIVQEKPIVYMKRPGGAGVAFGLMAACEAWCDLKGLRWESIQSAKLKQHATGKGNAKKEIMLEAARMRWPNIEIVDHNAADAMWLLDMTIGPIGLPEVEF